MSEAAESMSQKDALANIIKVIEKLNFNNDWKNYKTKWDLGDDIVK
jgi:hypothetical protein